MEIPSETKIESFTLFLGFMRNDVVYYTCKYDSIYDDDIRTFL